MRIFVYGLLIAGIAQGRALAAASAEEVHFFESKIRPVLADKCYSCHSVNAKKLKGDLLVDHLQFLQEGGDSGPAIVPGNPSESLLVEAVSYKNIDLQMPPKSKLSENQIADITRWVEMGAPWPDEPIPEGGTGKAVFDWQGRRDAHWCWQPIRPPAVPTESGKQWARTPVDHFIADRLEAAGIRPAPDADKRTWIRRVYFALIGLPPSVAQVGAFLADNSAEAFEQVVDELLASPHYGERWARHWLDLARYAESCGHEFDYTLDHAYQYRDYLIRAFNEDVPYDQFITEHIAGDLLKQPRRHKTSRYNESIIGTGFWYLHEAVHAPTDVLQDEADRIDNQIDVFSKTFLGLTIACSRCHDHKFDAIPAKDYYSLAGFLQSSRMQYAMLDPDSKIAVAVDALEPLRAKESALKARAENRAIVGAYLSAAQEVIDWKEPIPEITIEPSLADELLNGDIIFEDFERADYGDWTIVEGDAFGGGPVDVSKHGGNAVSGFAGKRWADSYPGTDAATGVVESAAFTIERDFINLLVGGGYHKEKTCVELSIGGKTVLSTEGKGLTDANKLTWRSWDVKRYKGKDATIRMVDRETGGWGHILVDHIVFSDIAARQGSSHSDLTATPVVVKIADQHHLNPVMLKKYADELASDAVKKDTHPFFAWHWYTAGAPDVTRYEDIAAKPETMASSGSVLEDFESGSFGTCVVRGQAFGMKASAGIADSGRLSKKLHGVLRTPTFELKGRVYARVRGEKADIRLIIDGYQMQPRNGLLFGGTGVNNLDTKGDWKWQMLGNNDSYLGHRAYLEFVDDGDGFIAIDEILIEGEPPKQQLHPASREVFTARPQDRGALVTAYSTLLNLQDLEARGLIPVFDQTLAKSIADIEAGIPGPMKVLAIDDGTGENESVFIRGNPHSKGELAPRQMPVAIAGEEQRVLTPEDGSGRIYLAEQMTDPANPFPARVVVNRLWHHLFGRGIVPTVDDFGVMGQPPSHPELLDWMAHDFVSNKNWSVKSMLKSLVLSSTYRQSSRTLDAHPEAARADPTNQLLHRMRIRRLEAEPIRDAVYAVSGHLNPQLYGPSVPVFLNRFQGGRGKPAAGPVDGMGRRSIYLAVRRNFMDSMMLTFDYPTPFNSIGRRSVSNVPAQALVMMNNRAVVDEAKRWAKTVIAEANESDKRIDRIYEQAFARLPTAAQREKMMRFVTEQAALYGADANDERVWADLCHVVFNMKEFIYIN